MTDLLFQFLAGFLYCLSRYIHRAGCIGTGIIGRRICVSAINNNIVQAAFQTFCCHLCQCSVTSRSHIRRSNGKDVKAFIVELDRSRTYIHTGNSRALH